LDKAPESENCEVCDLYNTYGKLYKIDANGSVDDTYELTK